MLYRPVPAEMSLATTTDSTPNIPFATPTGGGAGGGGHSARHSTVASTGRLMARHDGTT